MTNFFLKSLWAVWTLLWLAAISAAFCTTLGGIFSIIVWDFRWSIIFFGLRLSLLPTFLLYLTYLYDGFKEDSDDFVKRMKGAKK